MGSATCNTADERDARAQTSSSDGLVETLTAWQLEEDVAPYVFAFAC